MHTIWEIWSKYEPWYVISNNVVCATSKALNQPAHTHSLIRAFASRLDILWVLSFWLNIISRVHKLKRRLYRFVWVYTFQHATLLEITCRGTYTTWFTSYEHLHQLVTDGQMDSLIAGGAIMQPKESVDELKLVCGNQLLAGLVHVLCCLMSERTQKVQEEKPYQEKKFGRRTTDNGRRPITRSSLIWVHAVCYRDALKWPADIWASVKQAQWLQLSWNFQFLFVTDCCAFWFCLIWFFTSQ